MLYDPMAEPISHFRGEWRFLSNFYAAKVTMGRVEYPSVEHAYQAAKTDRKTDRNAIYRCVTAGAAKAYGRRVNLRPDWESVKLGIMEDLLRQKFEIWDMRGGLVRSWPRQLIEGNCWGDRFWGECDGAGENHLGRLLMKIRRDLWEAHTQGVMES